MKNHRLVAPTLVVAVTFAALFWNGKIVTSSINQLLSQAQAVIGRPLTPMSYAGVARRTVRRCAAGVYYC